MNEKEESKLRKHAETMADTVIPVIRGVLINHWQGALEEIRDHKLKSQPVEDYKKRLIKVIKSKAMDGPIECYFLDMLDEVME